MSDIKIMWRHYEVGTVIGAWLRSWERGVEPGTVRYLAGKTMYAYQVYWKAFRKPEVWWCPIENNSYEELGKWRKSL